jgi:hypothetical protein
MDNAMNNAGRAEQIADRVRDLEERLNAWIVVATENRSTREIALLNQVVEADVAQVRAPLDYRERVAKFQTTLHSATDDGTLILRLYEEIFLRSTV